MDAVPTDSDRRAFSLHFDTENYASVSCKQCLDYRLRQCEGHDYHGYECFTCIVSHAKAVHRLAAH